MVKANRKPRTAKGAVLIMVLTVMFVLIFLLAGTIAVVYSSNRRAMVKYQESQAYYTARSVLDTYFEALLKDNDAANNVSVTYYYWDKDPSNPANMAINTMSTMSQGRALELDLYKVPVSTEVNASSPDYNKWYAEKVAAGGGTFDNKHVNLTTLAVTGDGSANSANFYKQYTTNEWTSSMHVGVDDVIRYDVTDLHANNFQQENLTGGDSYDKLADLGAGNVWIEVQVLERNFDLDLSGHTQFYDQFKYGDRSKDHFKIKATAHVIYNGEETTTSRVFSNKDINVIPSSKAIVSLSDASGSDGFVAIGGASALNTIKYSNEPDTAGDVFVYGDLIGVTNTPKFRIGKDNVFLVKGDFIISNTPTGGGGDNTGKDIEAGATIVAKTIAMTKDGAQFISESGDGINFVADTIDFRNVSGTTMKGRFFCDNLILSGTQNGQMHVDGDVYCNYLTLEQNDFYIEDTGSAITVYVDRSNATAMQNDNDSVRKSINGKYNISKGFKRITANAGNGNYTVDTFNFSDIGGTVTYNGNLRTLSNIIWTDANASNTETYMVKNSNEVKVSYDNPAHFTYDSTTYKRTFVLPEKGIGMSDKNLVLDTPRSLYNAYFKETVTSADGTKTLGDTWDPNTGDFTSTVTDDSGNSYPIDMDADTSGITLQPLLETWQVQNTIDPNAYPTMADFGNDWGAWVQYWTDKANEAAIQANAAALAAVTGPIEDFMKEHIDYTDPTAITDTNLTGDDSHWTQAREDDCAAQGLPAIANIYTYVISADKQLSSADTKNKTIAIDTRTGPVNIQFGNGNGGDFYGTFVVIGDFPCNVILPDNGSNTSYTFGGDGQLFLIYDSRAGLGDMTSGASLRLGSASSPTPPPHINYLCGRNVSTLNFAQGTQGHIIQGYFTAPFTRFVLGGGNNGVSGVNITYDTFNFTETIAFAGSVFCKGFQSGQKPGVAYISNDQNVVNHGQTLFSWGTNYSLMG